MASLGLSQKAMNHKMKKFETGDVRIYLEKGNRKPNRKLIKAAETGPGSESDDDDPDPDEQDDKDARDIELAMTHAEMRKYMAAMGHSQMAIDRKIKEFIK